MADGFFSALTQNAANMLLARQQGIQDREERERREREEGKRGQFDLLNRMLLEARAREEGIVPSGGGYTFDPTKGRTAREESQRREREGRQRAAYEQLKLRAPEIGEFDPGQDYASLLLRIGLQPPERSTIKADGREFPDTPEGEAAALAWTRRRAGASRDKEGTADPTGQRQRVLAAAGELGEIQAKRTGLETTEQLQVINTRLQDVFRRYGFEGIEDLREQMRALGLGGEKKKAPEGEKKATDPLEAQRIAWDRAATVLRSQGKDPESVLGKRP